LQVVKQRPQVSGSAELTFLASELKRLSIRLSFPAAGKVWLKIDVFLWEQK
jgi:hypothetical protein